VAFTFTCTCHKLLFKKKWWGNWTFFDKIHYCFVYFFSSYSSSSFHGFNCWSQQWVLHPLIWKTVILLHASSFTFCPHIVFNVCVCSFTVSIWCFVRIKTTIPALSPTSIFLTPPVTSIKTTNHSYLSYLIPLKHWTANHLWYSPTGRCALPTTFQSLVQSLKQPVEALTYIFTTIVANASKADNILTICI